MKWVRPALSLIGFVSITAGFFLGKIEVAAYFGLVSGIIVWWFKARDSDKEKEDRK